MCASAKLTMETESSSGARWNATGIYVRQARRISALTSHRGVDSTDVREQRDHAEFAAEFWRLPYFVSRRLEHREEWIKALT